MYNALCEREPIHCISAGPSRSVRCVPDWESGGHGFDSPDPNHSLVEIDHEIFSTVTPLI